MTMRIVHISDLHFGTERDGVVGLLLQEINALKPSCVVISGDLTQRAKNNQFMAAQDFIHRLGVNTLCVPGNHDISLYNLIERFLFPFAKYKRFVSSNLCSYLLEDNIAILGVNSVTPYKPMGGYMTGEQLNLIKSFFDKTSQKVRIVVMHHNLIKSERHKIINQAEKIIDLFAVCKVNLILSGHIHFAHIERLKLNANHNPMYVITAGTPISTRTAALNSFNVIDINSNQFTLIVKSFQNNVFVTTSKKSFPL